MQVILLEDMNKLGKMGETVKVKSGFGRNFLLPQGKAIVANKENLAVFEDRRAELEKNASVVLAEAQKRAVSLDKQIVKMTVRASDEGKLYGSLGPRSIADACAEQGLNITKSEVDMPEGPIRNVGEYTVIARLHNDVKVEFQVVA